MSVLASEVLAFLEPKPGEVFVDATVGAGGHARLLAERLALGGRLIGLDQDPAMLDLARPRLEGLPVTLVCSSFDRLETVLDELGIDKVDGVLADLGICSDQLDDPERGLSFSRPGPLDMRLSREGGETAGDLLRRLPERDLADLIYEYGEERFSRRIARKIVERRKEAPLETTEELAELVRRCVPRSGGKGKGKRHSIDPATRVFQALRIAVNDELGALERLLVTLLERVKPGGRAAIISFHSLEDRRVKQAFRVKEDWHALTRKPVQAGEEEERNNPRSRSAKLRAARGSESRTNHDPTPVGLMQDRGDGPRGTSPPRERGARMLSKKTQYAWMAAGGMLGLLGLALYLQLRDSGRANAQEASGYKPSAEVKWLPVDKEPTAQSVVPVTEPGRKPDSPKELDPITAAPTTTAVSFDPTKAVPPPAAEGSTVPPLAVNPPAAPLPTTSEPKISGTAPTRTEPPLPPVSLDVKLSTPPPTAADPSLPSVTVGGTGTFAAGPPALSPNLTVPTPAPPTPTPAPQQNPFTAPAPDNAFKHDPEPPLAPAPGPTQTYQVHKEGETLLEIGKKTLPPSRILEVVKLNPMLKPDVGLSVGFKVKLPTDACIPTDEADGVKPLPALQPTKGVVAKTKTVLPLTGTYPCTLDDKRTLVLPKALREQLGICDTVVLSPGPDQCLWLTNQAHLDRLAQKLEASQAREIDIRVFKRLYFAQAEKTSLNDEGKVSVSDRLAQFAGLSQEVILIGTDDHFEVWDASRWKTYTQQKSAHIDE